MMFAPMYGSGEQQFSIYLVLTEEQEKQPGEFFVALPYPIAFPTGSHYSCAVEECYFEAERENPEDCLDIIIEAPGLITASVVNGATKPVLAVISTPMGGRALTEWKAGGLIFRPLVCSSPLEQVRITIETPKGKLTNFKKKRIMLHLIFRRDI